MSKKRQRLARRGSLLLYPIIIGALAVAVWYGRTRSGPDLGPYLQEIFPGATSWRQSDGVFSVMDAGDRLLGWASTGSSSGYGGPMLLLVGIDTTGNVAGASVVEHRETLVFWRMVRAPDFIRGLTGNSFDTIDYEYRDVVGVTGATRSSDAIVASVRSAVSSVAGEEFGVSIPLPRNEWEFGLLEIAVIVLFAAGIASVYLGGKSAAVLDWAAPATGLVLIGFWKNTPLTIAKIASLISGYFPNIRTNLALYLLVGGFILTVLVYGRSIYCTHLCPFGSAQKFINLIGGKRMRLPAWSVTLMRRSRNIVVLSAILIAIAMAKPALASYEPFAALFVLKGTVLQWFLLMFVLLFSLMISRPWCHFFCPVRTCERVLQDVRMRLPGWEDDADEVGEAVEVLDD